jgi:translation initiation factor IF-2
VVRPRTAEDDLLAAFTPEDAPELLVARPPVITILGHVDHGKTSLLDRIRKSNVVSSESGGITQHIGAYQVQYEGHPLTFVDTPGHEAFTAMRARGANVTDLVVLVVAADDGVMPQTQEAIAHAKAADVPIVIALNKIDLPNVNINRIYGELAQQDLAPEEYGGDTPVVKTSALTGQGIPELLEMLGIVAELRCADELRANPARPASGTCLESSISEGRGVVATVLVQDGTLKVGDVIVCGDGFGRDRALFDDSGRPVAEAGPSMPVEVSGLDAVPTAGEKFAVVPDISRAREVAETRRLRSRGVALGERQAVTLENLYSKMAEQKVKSLNLILKADVQGSLEALTKELEKLQNAEVPIRVLLKGVGGISESDILLADASQAIVIGFRVAPEDRALAAADEKKIDIRRYDIIYQVTDEIKKAVEGMLVPEIKEIHLGRAVVRQVFKISKVGTVAGCFVTQGLFERSAKVRLIREGREIYKGSLEALKRFKDDVKEVREGFECGIKIGNFDDIKVDDMIEAYRIDVIRRTLGA